MAVSLTGCKLASKNPLTDGHHTKISTSHLCSQLCQLLLIC